MLDRKIGQIPSKIQHFFFFFFFFFFSGAADEGFPRNIFGRSERRTPEKTKKSVNGRKFETTSCRMIGAGILWTMATCSAPWSVISDYVGPAECAGMLKLVTQPRSRRKRDWWRIFTLCVTKSIFFFYPRDVLEMQSGEPIPPKREEQIEETERGEKGKKRRKK